MLHAAILPIPVPFENASRSGAGIACLFTTKTRVSTSSPRKKLVVFRISPQWSQGRTWIGQLGSSEMSEETAETARDSALSLSLSHSLSTPHTCPPVPNRQFHVHRLETVVPKCIQMRLCRWSHLFRWRVWWTRRRRSLLAATSADRWPRSAFTLHDARYKEWRFSFGN